MTEEKGDASIVTSSSTREKLERKKRTVEDEYSQGDLTDKGYKRKLVELELELLEVDLADGDVTQIGYERKKKRLMDGLKNSGPQLAGEKKELEAIQTTRSHDAPQSGLQMADCLAEDAGKMRNTIASLFGREKTTSKGKGRAGKPLTLKPSMARKDKLLNLEVVCLPVDTNVVPRGGVRSALQKSGYIKRLVYRRPDPEEIMKSKIHSLFHFFSESLSEQDQYVYLHVSSNKLVRAQLPTDCTSWNGEAVTRLAGQGSLYVLPLSFCREEKEDASETQTAVHGLSSKAPTQQELTAPPGHIKRAYQGQQQPISVTVNRSTETALHTPLNLSLPLLLHSPSSTLFGNISTSSNRCPSTSKPSPPASAPPSTGPLLPALVPSSTSTRPSQPATAPPSSRLPPSAATSSSTRPPPPASSLPQAIASLSTLPSVISGTFPASPALLLQELYDLDIGGAALEFAGLAEPAYPSETNAVKGTVELYAVDWKIWQWIAWRKANNLPLPCRSADRYFYLISNEQLDEFLKFRDSSEFLSTPLQHRMVYFAPKALLLHWLIKECNKYVRVVERYEQNFIALTEREVEQFAQWVLEKREIADPFGQLKSA